jgi:hypothetical protein
MSDKISNFWKDNIISILGLIITIGGLLIHIGVTRSQIESTRIDVDDLKAHGSIVAQKSEQRLAILERAVEIHKSDEDRRMREMETLSRNTTDKMNEKLDLLNRQVSVLVAWVEEQKAAHH